MRRQPNGKKGKKKVDVWTYNRAKKALPYLKEITRSIRENFLAAQACKRQLDIIDHKKGRHDRMDFIRMQELSVDRQQLESKFQQDVDELEEMGIYLVSPIEGLIAIPFVTDEQLAWFLLELHAEDPLNSWRYQADPLETRRPVTPKEMGTTWVN